ncbi:dynamin family protein [Tabrizicola sp.]|uniref:dynamin family protein n=1 Tax=Tabrizicola sp. TaxID=2005166 RepID=UPI00286A01D3|nr:dynamin family protein [Tabrizicola sp.]
MDGTSVDPGVPVQPAFDPNLRRNFPGLSRIAEAIQDFEGALGDFVAMADPETGKKLTKILAQTRDIEPSVTVIGQIKAGKTSLVNAMIGAPGLLPTDVNPWTSVVTSLHINTPSPDPNVKAKFKFFDSAEWDRLISNGGRIGQLAARAGADDELEKLRLQVVAMREKARARLGRKFELLLGTEHRYAAVDDALLKRYVCVGDEDLAVEDQGRFVDITKSADLYIERADIPTSLCVRDTPGVNDTFMMREQITINAVRDSRSCIVVLSAHQALTTMDMALIRLIAHRASREIIIFVNRIDELSDPATQVPEIHRSILETLTKNNAPANIDIIFGSAHWANAVLSGTIDDMTDDSTDAAINWTRAAYADKVHSWSAEQLVWSASGVPALMDALAQRMFEGPVKDVLKKSARQALNLAQSLDVVDQVRILDNEGSLERTMSPAALDAELTHIERTSTQKLTELTNVVCADFVLRIDQSYERFLERATSSLIEHLQNHGEEAMWHYSPLGLRMLLSSSYQVVLKKMHAIAAQVNTEAAKSVADLYGKTFSITVEGFKIEVPVVTYIPPPINLGQTIALDLQVGWWKGWWQRRRGYQAFAEDFYKLIRAETDPIINDLKTIQIGLFRERTQSTLMEFLHEQRDLLTSALTSSDVSIDEMKELFGVHAWEERQECLATIMDELGEYAD